MRMRHSVVSAFIGLLGLSTFYSARTASAAIESAAPVSASFAVMQDRTFKLGVFQHHDGAIPIINNDERVDAYFATKALLTAHESGLDIREAGGKWVEWLLPRQKADGRFMRYTRQPAANGKAAFWKTTDIADADDSLLAEWVELLHALAPKQGMPAHWQKSAALASEHLATLRNNKGIFYIARENRVGLFMDNTEVYASFMNIARDQVRLGQTEQAKNTLLAAQNLGVAIQKVFWDKKNAQYLVSTQVIPDSVFYPQAPAQVFPMLSGLKTPVAADNVVFAQWLARHGENWLQMKHDEYPWGLIAFAAWKIGDNNTAQAWQNQNRKLRFGPQWTVLDEAVYQGLQANLPTTIRSAQYDPRLASLN